MRTIFATGYDFVSNRAGIANEEHARLLSKPYHAWELLCAVRESLEESAEQGGGPSGRGDKRLDDPRLVAVSAGF